MVEKRLSIHYLMTKAKFDVPAPRTALRLVYGGQLFDDEIVAVSALMPPVSMYTPIFMDFSLLICVNVSTVFRPKRLRDLTMIMSIFRLSQSSGICRYSGRWFALKPEPAS